MACIKEVPYVEVELLVELPDTCGTGDIDFRDLAADDVQAHEQHAALRQRRPDLGAKPAVPLVQGPADAWAPAARLPRLSAADGMRARA